MTERDNDIKVNVPQRFQSFVTNEVEAVADLYADVFAGDPWNEVTRCACSKFYGAETNVGEPCPCNDCVLMAAYPRTETVGYIKKELGRTDARGFTIKEGNETVGFSWGFPYQSPGVFAFEKYRTQEMREAIAATLYNSGVEGRFFYFSECGVKESARGKGYSNALSKSLADSAKWSGLPLVMRTNVESPMTAVAQKFGMTQIMGPIPIINRDAGEIKAGNETVVGLDLENANRVLFMLQ